MYFFLQVSGQQNKYKSVSEHFMAIWMSSEPDVSTKYLGNLDKFSCINLNCSCSARERAAAAFCCGGEPVF